MFSQQSFERRKPYERTESAYVRGYKCETPCECSICQEQFIGTQKQDDGYYYSTVVAPVTAQATLAALTSKIKADRAYLAELCAKFGNTILSRWRKKSRDKREALLLLADPTIEKDPWFRLHTEGAITNWKELRKCRKSWLLPYLNTATLKANPLVLVGLLHNRVQHSPEEWVSFDSAIVRQGWDAGLLDLEYCGQYCVIMHGVNYGKLVSWNKDAAERYNMVGYPRARLILEAQALMFSRLRDIVDLILEGVDRDTTGASDRWRETVKLGFKQCNNIELWSDYVNQPFSAPPRFDVDYYCSIAKARMQAVQDHLWLLQTDPSYFRRFIKVLAVGEIYKTVWRYAIIARDAHLALLDYLTWRALYAEWTDVRDHYRRFRDSIHPGQPLPSRLEHKLAALELSLVGSVTTGILHLPGFIAQRPGFQHNYKFAILSKPPSRPGQNMYSIEAISTLSEYQQYREDTLEWILTELLCEPNQELRFDHPELFARLEAHLAEASPEERARMDETIYAKMSDYALRHEMLSALKLHRPGFLRFSFEGKSAKDALKWVEESSTPSMRIMAVDVGGYYKKYHEFPADPIEALERLTPAVGRKSEAWLERRTAERKVLRDFWRGALESFRVEASFMRMTQEELDDAFSVISVSTSAEYAEIVENERMQVADAIAAAATKKKVANTASIPDILWSKDPDISKLVIEERAPKQKTRPSQPVGKADSPEPLVNADATSPSQPKISTTPRALDIIRKMFPSSAEETSAKDTDWDLFVHAMNDLTFSARNVGGSAVAFEHPSNKKIIFHRPHPVAKIDSIMLQSMGKRLRKHFDWSREAFIGV
ncbi:hypothetical protein KCU81_g3898, partial [Aureobasidium melanogenum]|uniref:Uncharacterized protein n=1 Tax=Aureobasidium melanogenum (strain CBS 110374) TaxID=1043003 RepID=A0A074VTH6_AURM1